MKLICQGKTVNPGNAFGKILVVSEDNISSCEVDKNTILFLENSSPIYAILIMQAGGVIIKEGGIYAHTCLLTLEMGIPCITQVGKDIYIEKNKAVYMDASAGEVYEYETT